ncbi:hypothetical protein [Marmoricola endophyticus]|uniref:hypothetical protein n=1 Tax=Marmoricola endophyticus TaxID=2040280 RepID=UPI001E541F18|nr:hypothetical protein [Marmoricola endophyticus]
MDALSAPLLFLALSLDAKVHAGHWSVVSHAEVRASIPLPAYKEVVSSPENVEVVDFSGTRRRSATRLEAAALRERKVVAPVRLERAFRASLGLEPWIDAFDDLLVRGQVTSSDIFG